MGVDIWGVNVTGVDVLGVDVLALIRVELPKIYYKELRIRGNNEDNSKITFVTSQ